MANGAKRPTHVLKVREKDGHARCVVGSGWLWEDGSISIVLNPCVVLQRDDALSLKLFPAEGWDGVPLKGAWSKDDKGEAGKPSVPEEPF